MSKCSRGLRRTSCSHNDPQTPAITSRHVQDQPRSWQVGPPVELTGQLHLQCAAQTRRQSRLKVRPDVQARRLRSLKHSLSSTCRKGKMEIRTAFLVSATETDESATAAVVVALEFWLCGVWRPPRPHCNSWRECTDTLTADSPQTVDSAH